MAIAMTTSAPIGPLQCSLPYTARTPFAHTARREPFIAATSSVCNLLTASPARALMRLRRPPLTRKPRLVLPTTGRVPICRHANHARAATGPCPPPSGLRAPLSSTILRRAHRWHSSLMTLSSRLPRPLWGPSFWFRPFLLSPLAFVVEDGVPVCLIALSLPHHRPGLSATLLRLLLLFWILLFSSLSTTPLACKPLQLPTQPSGHSGLNHGR